MPTSPNRLFTSHEAAVLLQMDPSSIVKWVNDGILPAYRTPGGHRRIRAQDLLAFLKQHSMFVPSELAEGQVQMLVVDDDPNFLKALARSMKAHKDLEFNTCTSGIEALVRVGAQRPDVLVIDVHMPEVDGFDVLRALKASASTKEIQVVMVSGKPTSDLEKKALNMGAKAVLSKPLDAAKLLETVSGKRA